MPFKILPYAISATVVAAAVAMSRADEAGTIVLTNGVIRAEIVPA